jgi:S-DNA-T family DNA segregation ATPase FtsK/SpoIIIE
MDRCLECAFDGEALPAIDVADALRALEPRFLDVLAGVDHATAMRRPAPAVWSALEYCCHVRDVLLIQRDRAVLALVEERPSFSRMYREERVTICDYSAHGPLEVLGQLSVAFELCATVFAGIEASAFARPFIYAWPEPAERDLAWLGRHTVHEATHHQHDVVAVLDRLHSSR